MIARKYLYLIALAREKHFGRAAASCHVSPSTLSAAIRDLESELGVAIVERGQQFSGLTPEGLRVVRYAEVAASHAADLKQELAQLRDGGLSGQIRIGVIPTALTAVAAYSAAIVRRHPHITLQIVSLPTGDILTQLRRYELEAGVIYLRSATDPDLEVVRVWEEDHVLLTTDRDAVEGRDEISWREAASFNLCLLSPDMQNRRTIDETFAALGCHPAPTMETNSIVSLLAHVCSGAWSSIVPRSVLELIGSPEAVSVLRLTEPSVAWATGVVTLARDPVSPSVAALRAVAQALTASFGNDE
ncbi:LysR family transcriptional regulator [Denitromonas iodatirespirans]|uniref:LysR family transcriptional regulator n=1 Tax=Denitromonas iodatirespirans TaxID=2795389 RepID=A0A944DED5_DENI1|nr:LysR substrate-binding domain-containing protein [Denitromonas iodatirespirans]MBT0963466.1 LysR family transcriptional regulator [Denitromonas iodatirespirans]